MLVLGASSLVIIKKIKLGDTVYVADAETLVVSIKPIIETYIRETSNIVHITINGENIQYMITRIMWKKKALSVPRCCE